MEFYIRHIGTDSGVKLVNKSITYTDDEGNSVTFPDPSVTVDCGTVVHPEPCIDPVELPVDGWGTRTWNPWAGSCNWM